MISVCEHCSSKNLPRTCGRAPKTLTVKHFQTIAILTFTLFSGAIFGQRQYDVYVFVAEECPISIYMARPLREAAKAYSNHADFYAVFPVATSTETTAAEFLDKYQLTAWQAKLDPAQALTRQLGATVTPEVVIVDRVTRRVYYRGRVSNAYAAPGKMRHGERTNELRTMLRRLEEGHTPTAPWPSAVGCFITAVNGEG